MHVLRRSVEPAVGSGLLGKSYLESVPRSHYGQKETFMKVEMPRPGGGAFFCT